MSRWYHHSFQSHHTSSSFPLTGSTQRYSTTLIIKQDSDA
jgi:hypothetical protein